jgi:hypothetical protein
MIIRVAVKTPTNAILYKTYLGVTALVDPNTHILQIFDRKQRVVAQYPANSFHWWASRASTLQLPLTRAGKLLHGV